MILLAISFFVEGLYWYPSETVDWAYVHSINGDAQQSTYKSFVFECAPGVRAGLGYTYNAWDTQASYTFFQSKANDQAHGSVTSGFLGARLSLLEPFTSAKASQNLHYNMVEWDLGYSFFCEQLTFRPSIGLKGGWIAQKIRSHWETPNFLSLFTLLAEENLSHHFKAIGPKAGLLLNWCLTSSISLTSQLEAAYLWGHWSIQDKYVDNLATVIQIKTPDRNFGSYVLHALLGLAWTYDPLTLQLSYELEDWFNQFQIYSNISGSQNNDLFLQGLNLRLVVAF